MTRRFSLAVAALTAAMAAIPVLAQQQPPMRGRGGPGPDGHGPVPIPILRGLDLTDAQREQIRAITGDDPDKGPGPGRRMAEMQQALQLAILADIPDARKIDELKAGIAALSAEALAHRIEVETRIAQILTPEQRAQARDSVGQAGPPNGRMGRGRGR